MPKLVDILVGVRERARLSAQTPDVFVQPGQLDKLVTRLQSREHDVLSNQIADTSGLSLGEKVGASLLFSVVNYCFVDPASAQDYEVTIDGTTKRRSTALVSALLASNASFDDPVELAKLPAQYWRDMLQLDEAGVVLYDGEDRTKRLVAMSGYLANKQVAPSQCFEQYKTADDVAELLLGSGLFDDPFAKRLQIELLWLHEIAAKHDIDFVIPFDHMTIMADYRLPQVLIQTGVLGLSPTATAALDGVLDSELLENALRANAIIVGEILAERLGVSTAVVDQMLWKLSQDFIAAGSMQAPAIRVQTNRY